MKTFIAYRHTGEDLKVLTDLLTPLKAALEQQGISVYCTFFDEQSLTVKGLDAAAIMRHAFTVIDSVDFLLVVQATEKRSEGMLMEVGYCIAKSIPVVVAVNETVRQTYVPDMAKHKIVWKANADLAAQIAGVDFVRLLTKA